MRAPLFDEFLRLGSFNALIFFSACKFRGDVVNCFGISFHSQRRTSTGNALLSVRSHVSLRLKTYKNKKTSRELFGEVPEGSYALRLLLTHEPQFRRT